MSFGQFTTQSTANNFLLRMMPLPFETFQRFYYFLNDISFICVDFYRQFSELTENFIQRSLILRINFFTIAMNMFHKMKLNSWKEDQSKIIPTKNLFTFSYYIRFNLFKLFSCQRNSENFANVWLNQIIYL